MQGRANGLLGKTNSEIFQPEFVVDQGVPGFWQQSLSIKFNIYNLLPNIMVWLFSKLQYFMLETKHCLVMQNLLFSRSTFYATFTRFTLVRLRQNCPISKERRSGTTKMNFELFHFSTASTQTAAKNRV